MATPRSNGSNGNGRMQMVFGHRQTLIREALAAVFEKAGFEVKGTGSTVKELAALAREHKPQIILLDWQMDGAGVDSVKAMHSMAPDPSIAILFDPQSVADLFSSMEAGVHGYLSHNLEQDQLVDSLRLIARGQIVISREIGQALVESMARGNHHPHEQLTERELQVLAMVGRGASNKEIAETLIITENTAKVHLRNILDKLNLRNRQQAAAYAAQQGIRADIEFD